MSDQRKKNLAIDYALDLVDPDHRVAVGRCLEEDGELWEDVARFEEVAADLSLLAPQVSPSSSLCNTIIDRIDRLDSGGDDSLLRDPRIPHRPRLLSLGGWAVAACLAIAAIVLALRNQQYRHDLEAMRDARRGKADLASSERSSRGSEEGAGGAENGDEGNFERGGAAPKRIVDQQPRVPLEKRGKNYRLRQDVDALRDRVADLKRVREERFRAVPGLARLTVIEMVAGNPEPEIEEAADPDSQQDPGSEPVGETGTDPLIAQATSTYDPAVEPVEPIGGSSVSVLSDALATGLVGLGYLDVSVFPEFAFDLSDDSDSVGFTPAASVAQRAPDNQVEVVPELVPDPDLVPELPPAPDPELPVAPNEAAPHPPTMAAYTIYDETTGHGSILVQNLPAADKGTRYQLWMGDNLEPQPINVGALPELENGGGHIFFELGEGGYSPSEFFLTLESEAGTDVPTGDPVLLVRTHLVRRSVRRSSART